VLIAQAVFPLECRQTDKQTLNALPHAGGYTAGENNDEVICWINLSSENILNVVVSSAYTAQNDVINVTIFVAFFTAKLLNFIKFQIIQTNFDGKVCLTVFLNFWIMQGSVATKVV